MIHKNANIENEDIGEGTVIWAYTHICKYALIGKNCNIGEFVHIGPGVIIGDGCKIQNYAMIPGGVEMGNNVFIGPHVCFTNDKYPDAKNRDFHPIKTYVENEVSIGANVTILPGIVIRSGTMIGAGAIVTKDTEMGQTIKGKW